KPRRVFPHRPQTGRTGRRSPCRVRRRTRPRSDRSLRLPLAADGVRPGQHPPLPEMRRNLAAHDRSHPVTNDDTLDELAQAALDQQRVDAEEFEATYGGTIGTIRAGLTPYGATVG